MELPLNKAQQAAVEHVHGPMLVVAGAGTGKTRVLVERIARLVRRGHARPDEILAITYTIPGAAELSERVQKKLGCSASDVQASTFHAYCMGQLIRAGRGFRVLDDKDLWVFLRRRLSELPLDRFIRAAQPAEFLHHLLGFFERCQDELVDVAGYENFVRDLREGRRRPPRVAKPREGDPVDDAEAIERCAEIAHVFRKVEEMLAADNLGTFGHMIVRAVELLQRDPDLLRQEQQRARFILIDEFQDSNVAQIELARLLAGESRNVFAVGDYDQAIYRFRGASSAAFEHFLRVFPEAREVSLAENHRSLVPILECAFAAITANPEIRRLHDGVSVVVPRRKLISAREQTGESEPRLPVEMMLGVNALAEAAAVAAHIRVRQEETECEWRKFAVLYRAHSARKHLLEELAARGIPFAVVGEDVLETGPVRDVLAVLAAIESSRDAVGMMRLSAQPGFGIDPVRLRRELKRAGENVDWFDLLERVPRGKRLKQFVQELRRMTERVQRKAVTAVQLAASGLNLDSHVEPVLSFRSFVENWSHKPLAGDGSLAEFLEFLKYFQEAGGSVPLVAPEERNAVRLMTVHAAKGREFDHVYVLRLNKPSFPTPYREPLFEFPAELRGEHYAAEGEGKEVHEQEERRLFYVAVTRARDSLVLSARETNKGIPYAGFARDLWTQKDVRPFLAVNRVGMSIDVKAAAAAPVSAVSRWLDIPPGVDLAERPLSATTIEMYKKCPLQFKLAYDWKLPGKPAAAMQFGAAVHTTLREYYESMRQGRQMQEKEVLTFFLGEMKKGSFDDPVQRRLYVDQGKKQLAAFLAARAAEPPAEILATEKQFKARIGGTWVIGRADRLDRLDGNRVRIVDYKTGSPRSQEAADESLQLSLYALGARADWGLEAESLVYYNLETNIAITTTRTEEQLAQAEKSVREVAARIVAGDFAARPDYHCRWCPYRTLCPETEGRLHGSDAGVFEGVN